MTTRCRFGCVKVEKQCGGCVCGAPFVYTAHFSAVIDGSEENKKFFAYTPSGKIEVGVYKEDIFIPGKEYYIDITEA